MLGVSAGEFRIPGLSDPTRSPPGFASAQPRLQVDDRFWRIASILGSTDKAAIEG